MTIEPPPRTKPNVSKYVQAINDPVFQRFIAESDEKYFYWSELKRRPDIPFKTPETAWGLVKFHRSLTANRLTLGAHRFKYNITNAIQKNLHDFDLKLMGGLLKDSITPEDQAEYLKNSLLEEAIASSQLEGAATTTVVARKMIKSGRNPKNESEQMILNNYSAIRVIGDRLEEPLTVGLIIDIHALMTAKTDASRYAGKFRDHPIYIKDHVTGDIAYTAPPFEQVNKLVDRLLDFVNNEAVFVHPIVKASMLHFLIGYIHPFGDGNGRTARALFYWFLIKKGYALLRHISISKAILKSRTRYDKAFLQTEADDNDLTYFIMYSVKNLRVAFQNLMDYRDKKREEGTKANRIVYALIEKGYSKRQSELLGYLFLKRGARVTISTYAERNDIVRQTASRDLTALETAGLLAKHKEGRAVFYELANINALKEILDGTI